MTDEPKQPEDELQGTGPEGAEATAGASTGDVPAPQAEADQAESSAGDAASTAASGETEAKPAQESAAGREAQGDVEPANGEEQPHFDWYILKVASNREESVRDALLRRVKIEGLEEYVDEVIVPTETISEYKNGKRRTKKQKIWPGYLVAHMVITDDTWFVVRETPGIGDFTGAAGKPTPMQPHEVERVLALVRPPAEKPDKARPVISFKAGDRVKINEGTFQNFEGHVEAVDEANGLVTVMINIFGRSTPVELPYWQVEAV